MTEAELLKILDASDTLHARGYLVVKEIHFRELQIKALKYDALPMEDEDE